VAAAIGAPERLDVATLVDGSDGGGGLAIAVTVAPVEGSVLTTSLVLVTTVSVVLAILWTTVAVVAVRLGEAS
jgi:hypothetical protein